MSQWVLLLAATAVVMAPALACTKRGPSAEPSRKAGDDAADAGFDADHYRALPVGERIAALRADVENPGDMAALLRAIEEVRLQQDALAFSLALDFIYLRAPEVSTALVLEPSERYGRLTRDPPHHELTLAFDPDQWVWNAFTEVYENRAIYAESLTNVLAAIRDDPRPNHIDGLGGALDERRYSLARFMRRESESALIAAWESASAEQRAHILFAASFEGVRNCYLMFALQQLAEGGAMPGPYGRATAFVNKLAPALAQRLDLPTSVELAERTRRGSGYVPPALINEDAELWAWSPSQRQYVPDDPD